MHVCLLVLVLVVGDDVLVQVVLILTLVISVLALVCGHRCWCRCWCCFSIDVSAGVGVELVLLDFRSVKFPHVRQLYCASCLS